MLKWKGKLEKVDVGKEIGKSRSGIGSVNEY